MTLTAPQNTLKPAASVAMEQLHWALDHAEQTGYDFIPPRAVRAAIVAAWLGEPHGETEDFASFVGGLVQGKKWTVDREGTYCYVNPGGSNARITLLRDNAPTH